MSAIDLEKDDQQVDQENPEAGEFQRMKDMVLQGHRARGGWRTEAIRAFDFVAGHQWSDEDKRILDEQKRPSVTFNRTAPIIKAVCGLEVSNRQGVVFLPRKVGDTGVNEVYTSAAKWMRDECDAEDEESEAFRDATICGEGWVENRMEYDEVQEGKFIEERMDPLEMGVNKGACKANYKDARMMYRVRDMEILDVKDMFPDLEPAAINAKWLDNADTTPEDGGVGFKRDYPDETRSALKDAAGQLTKCRVIQVQWWERSKTYLVAQEGEDLQQLGEEDFKKFSGRATAAGIKFDHVSVPQKVYYEAFLGATGFLPDEQGSTKRKLEMGMFQWRVITGERDRKKKCFYGLLRDMFDPQMWANKWLSQTMQIMNSNAKGGILAETDAFVNQRRAEEDWADPTKIVWVKPGAVSAGKIKDRIPPPLPQGLGDLMQFALSSLRDTTGVNLELLGQADREQAASLEMQRRQSAMTILATLFDSLRRFRKVQGRAMINFIEMLPEGTLIRIVEKGLTKYIPLVKDKDSVKYDVIVDEAPSSPNQKQAVWAMVMQLLQSGIQLSPQTVVQLLKYSPLPESVVAEIEQAMGMASTMNPQQLQQRLQQAEQALHVMEEELKKATETANDAENDRSIDMMKLEIEEYKAETMRLQAMWTARISAVQATSDAAATPDPENAGDADNAGQGGGGVPAHSDNNEALNQLGIRMDQLVSIVGALAQQLSGEPANTPQQLDPMESVEPAEPAQQ